MFLSDARHLALYCPPSSCSSVPLCFLWHSEFGIVSAGCFADLWPQKAPSCLLQPPSLHLEGKEDVLV